MTASLSGISKSETPLTPQESEVAVAQLFQWIKEATKIHEGLMADAKKYSQKARTGESSQIELQVGIKRLQNAITQIYEFGDILPRLDSDRKARMERILKAVCKITSAMLALSDLIKLRHTIAR